jgi:hypothetical protein
VRSLDPDTPIPDLPAVERPSPANHRVTLANSTLRDSPPRGSRFASPGATSQTPNDNRSTSRGGRRRADIAFWTAPMS